jgi:3-oxoacyl-[acyl-carrier protein] reductase
MHGEFRSKKWDHDGSFASDCSRVGTTCPDIVACSEIERGQRLRIVDSKCATHCGWGHGRSFFGKIFLKEWKMDLGITGKRAVVCASSKGLGLGCARALAAEGVNLVMNARGAEALEAAAAEIRTDFGVDVTAVAADITSESERGAVLEAAGDVDILVTSAGGPPLGIWSDWSRDDFIAAIDANMLTPIALMQAVLPKMMERGWGRVVNITSMSVKSPIAILGLSNAARTGLTGFVAGTSRQVAPDGVVINNLLPGIHATDRSISLDGKLAATQGSTIEQVRAGKEATIPVRRYGTASEFGATCAFLCSQHAGFIIGQNILLDGGMVNSTM